MRKRTSHNGLDNAVETLMVAHPTHSALPGLGECVQACVQCADVCAACADIFMAEDKLSMFRKGMRAALDCADVCSATARILSRQTEPDLAVIRDQVISCATAARTAGEECARHRDLHSYCQAVAAICQRCEDSCRALLEVIPLHSGT